MATEGYPVTGWVDSRMETGTIQEMRTTLINHAVSQIMEVKSKTKQKILLTRTPVKE